MKTYKCILVQIIFLLLMSHLSFSQEVEVNLGGNSVSDAFVVKDSSGSVLLRMDGDKNFGVNSEQPSGIDLRYGEPEYAAAIININGNINIESGEGGDVNIAAGYDCGAGGSVNIFSGSSCEDAGDVTIWAASSNGAGGSMLLGTGGCNWGSNSISLKTGELGTGYGNNQIVLECGYVNDRSNGKEVQQTESGIILSPLWGLVEIIGSGTYTGTWTQASDERYKSNIKPISGILNKVEMLKPVEYEWNKEEYPDNNFPDGNQIGLVAQEVEKLFPEMVATNKDGYKSIDYSKISVLLIQAVKEQQNKIEKQSDEIEKQSAKNEKQADEISKMKSDIEELKSLILQDSNKFTLNDDLSKED